MSKLSTYISNVTPRNGGGDSDALKLINSPTYPSCRAHSKPVRPGFAISDPQYVSPIIETLEIKCAEGYAKSNEGFEPGDEIITPLNNTYYD